MNRQQALRPQRFELWVLAPIWLIVPYLQGACAGSLLTKNDYRNSLHHYYHDDPVGARSGFPMGERGGFIVTMEKTYLDLLRGKVALEDLQAHADLINTRVRYDVSRELESFFFVETADGYYASEHEVVWMHFLLSWGYALGGNSDAACVEAKKAAQRLSYEWSAEGHFDDPMLRILLASFWAMCGEWDEARVDLRRSYRLDASLTWGFSTSTKHFRFAPIPVR